MAVAYLLPDTQKKKNKKKKRVILFQNEKYVGSFGWYSLQTYRARVTHRQVILARTKKRNGGVNGLICLHVAVAPNKRC